MNKHVYYYDKFQKKIGDVSVQGNYVMLTAQGKDKKDNIINLNYLADMGISTYSLLSFIPNNVSNYNMLYSLKLLTNIAILGLYLSQIKSPQEDSNHLMQFNQYDHKIMDRFDELDLLSVDTSQNRIFYSYYRQLILLNLQQTANQNTIHLLFNNLFIFTINVNRFTILDCIFLQYLLLGYQNYTNNKKLVENTLNILDAILNSKNKLSIHKTIEKLHSMIAQLKNLGSNSK